MKEGGDEFQEILSRLREIQNSQTPLVDPTLNVFELVRRESARQDELREAAQKRADDLRDLAITYQLRLDAAEAKRIDSERATEKGRVDALLAAQNQNAQVVADKLATTATTLAQQVVATADAMRESVAATSRQTNDLITVLRDSHDKRLTELEQNRWNTGGIYATQQQQRAESRTQANWSIGQWVTIGGIVIVAVIDLHSRGVI
jgi:hypothetical protein